MGLVAKAVGAGFRILAVGVWKLASWVIFFLSNRVFHFIKSSLCFWPRRSGAEEDYWEEESI